LIHPVISKCSYPKRF